MALPSRPELREALGAVCADLERHEPDAPSLAKARAVLAAMPPKQRIAYPLAELRWAYEAGATWAGLGARFGGSESTLRHAVRRAGGVIRPPGPVPREADPETVAALAAAYGSGKSLLACGAAHGMDVRNTRRVLSEAGVAIRARGKQPLEDTSLDEIMRLRCEGGTFASVGAALGVSGERIRQRVAQAGRTAEFHACRGPTVYERDREARLAAAVADYEAGASQQHAAGRHHVSVVALRQALRDAGIPARCMGLDPERDARIAGLYRAGVRTDAIRAGCGVSAMAVYRALRRQGIEPGRHAHSRG